MEKYLLSAPEIYREYFYDDTKALLWLRALRQGWIKCPDCRREIWLAPKASPKITKYTCPKCHYRFSDFSGTLLQDNKLAWSKVVAGVHLFAIGKSAFESAKILGINYKSAHSLFNKIRWAIFYQHPSSRKLLKFNITGRRVHIWIKKRFVKHFQKGINFYRHTAAYRKPLYLKEQEFRYKERHSGDLLRTLLGYLLSTEPAE
jgi:transposase-like protein